MTEEEQKLWREFVRHYYPYKKAGDWRYSLPTEVVDNSLFQSIWLFSRSTNQSQLANRAIKLLRSQKILTTEELGNNYLELLSKLNPSSTLNLIRDFLTNSERESFTQATGSYKELLSLFLEQLGVTDPSSVSRAEVRLLINKGRTLGAKLVRDYFPNTPD